jgi:TRAP-type C4-dicarboxylate transport system permease small subunit
VIRIVDGYFRLLKLFIALCLAVMVVLVYSATSCFAMRSIPASPFRGTVALALRVAYVRRAAVAMRDHAHLGMDSVVARLPAWGKKACLIASNVLMLYCVYLFFRGSWAQTVINVDNMAPATGLSQGWFFYSVGIFFCITAARTPAAQPLAGDDRTTGRARSDPGSRVGRSGGNGDPARACRGRQDRHAT